MWQDIVDRLEALGRFETVLIGEQPARRNDFGADACPVAIVTPTGGDEMDDADDFDDVRNIVKGEFTVSLVVRARDPVERFVVLDQLRAAVMNAIDGQPLGGLTMPAFTRIRRWKYPPADDPEKQLVLSGEYSYIVDGHAAHDETDADF